MPPEERAAGAAEDPAPNERSVDAFLISGLSNRELDVLLLLGERLTNKGIAERLHISPIAVNLYRKLEANGRRQAVQLGLLPSNRT